MWKPLLIGTVLSGGLAYSAFVYSAGNQFYGAIGLHRAEYDLGGFDESDTGLFVVDAGYSLNDFLPLKLATKTLGKLKSLETVR